MALYHTLEGVQIPAGMVWSDEFDWTPVESTSEYSIGGSLLVDVGARLAGQPVTLSGAEDQGWISRTALAAVYALTATPGATYTLTLADGRSFDVMFSPAQEAISARPLFAAEIVPGTAWYIATIRLIKV